MSHEIKQRAVVDHKYERLNLLLYGIAAAVSVSVWFVAIRAPLWLDETVSYWAIAGGLKQVWSRSVEALSFPAYFYILWFTKAMLGSREIVLRIPSILAMLAASYVFYRCARRLFAQDAAVAATLFFILDGRIVFAAIDVRPYAWALFATSLALLAFINWSAARTPAHAAIFGISLASVFYFHYLFGCMLLVAFAVLYAVDSRCNFDLKQVGIVVTSFLLVVSPVLSRLLYVHATRQAHVFAGVPTFTELLKALGPGAIPFVVTAGLVSAAASRRLARPDQRALRHLSLCLTLALVPALILYGVSITTALHIFVGRYQAVAVPGTALLWGWLFNLIQGRRLKALGCVALVVFTVSHDYRASDAKAHSYSWKSALQSANANAARDAAPLIVCSDLPDADFEPMPTGEVANSVLFAPLSYYRVASPVVPMPRALNNQAKEIGRQVFLWAAVRHERFLALAFRPSYPTLDWLVDLTSFTHVAHVVGDYDGVAVVEFDPRN